MSHRWLPRSRSFAWLLLGMMGLAFGQGHWPIGIAAIVGVFAMVRFVRTAPATAGVILFLVAHVLVWEFAYQGMVPLSLLPRLGMEVGVSMVLALIFWWDRWGRRRRPTSFSTTLLLPCGWVVYEFLSARLSPGASWGSLAYSFLQPIALAQVASLFGWLGLTFLVVWVASIADWSVEQGLRSAAGRKGFAILLATTIAAFTFGYFRLATDPDAPRLRVACIVAPNTFNREHVNEVWAYTRGVKASDESRRRAIERIAASMREHFAAVERAARHGAHMVLWAEVNATVTAREEPDWVARARRLARQFEIYVGMGLSVFRPATREPSINKFVLVKPNGEVAFDFLKATRPPGAGHVVGDGVLPVLDTNPGRLSAAICFDMDFPQLIAQAGRAEVDLFLAPSNDWPEVSATHARMARMRAIEQGFALVRPTKDGISLITDTRGRELKTLALDNNEEGMLLGDAPRRRAPTLYAAIGDLFAWVCCVGLLVLSLLSWLRPSSPGSRS